MWLSTRAAKRRSSRARSPGATSRHAGNASAARSMIASVSAAVASSTAVTGSAVAGVTTVNVVLISHPLEAAAPLPVGDRGAERGELDVGHVGVVVHDCVPERSPGDCRARERLPGLGERPRNGGAPGRVGVAFQRGLEI